MPFVPTSSPEPRGSAPDPGARRGSTPIRQARPLHLRRGRAIPSMKPAQGTRAPDLFGGEAWAGQGTVREPGQVRCGGRGPGRRGASRPVRGQRRRNAPRWRAWLQFGLQLNAVRRRTRRTDQARWSSLNRSEQLRPRAANAAQVRCVRGHEKVPVYGQVEVLAGGQLKVPIPRSPCRPGLQGLGGDGGGVSSHHHRPGSFY